ncbi:pyruvate/2-oxoglutarate dehydrogenase complex dihydrolipoamide acyltransferase (E2) component [Bradyrhizobium ottawaense]
MSGLIDIKVPDIGDFKNVPVIEVFVKPGDKVKAEDPLVALESDKATMEVPSPRDGVVKAVVVKVGDEVSEGVVIVQFEGAGAEQVETRPVVSAPPSSVSAPAGVAEVRVPDIGDFKDVPVIEIFVKPGDSVKAEDPLIALESDKATMEVPAPLSGTVREIKVKTGDKVSEGAIILVLATSDASTTAASAAPAPAAVSSAPTAAPVAQVGGVDEKAFALAYAGPAVRKLAREMGVDLGKVKGSGSHGRIVREDVEAVAKGGASAAKPQAAPASGGGVGGIDLLPWPKIDFAKFGPVERKELGRIKKIFGSQSASQLGRHPACHDP